MAFEGYASTGLSVAIIIVVVVLGIGLLGAAFWMFQLKKKYSQFKCTIWERDGFGQLSQKHDDAGIFIDSKTNNKRFFMRKANVGLEPDNIPYVIGHRGSKFVYLYRTGLKNFAFIKPNISTNGRILLSVGEEDVNWAINAYERQKKIFSNNLLMQYLPFIALAFVSIIILVIFIYFFKDFDVLKDTALALGEAARALAAANSGTVILPP